MQDPYALEVVKKRAECQEEPSSSSRAKPKKATGAKSVKYKEKIERLVRRILSPFTKETAMVGKITEKTFKCRVRVVIEFVGYYLKF